MPGFGLHVRTGPRLESEAQHVAEPTCHYQSLCSNKLYPEVTGALRSPKTHLFQNAVHLNLICMCRVGNF